VTRLQLNCHLPARPGTHVSCSVSVVPLPQPQSAVAPSRLDRRQLVVTPPQFDLPRLAVTQSRLNSRLPARLVILVSCLASVVPLPRSRQAVILFRPGLQSVVSPPSRPGYQSAPISPLSPRYLPLLSPLGLLNPLPRNLRLRLVSLYPPIVQPPSQGICAFREVVSLC